MAGPNFPSELDPTAVVEAAAESILITTAVLEPPGPTVVYVNPAFERMTGWSKADIVGHSPRLLQGEKTDKTVFGNLRETLARGEAWEGQAINYRRDGSEFVMEWTIVALRDAAGVDRHYLSVQRDVTSRVEAERELAAATAAAFDAERRRANLARYFSPRIVDLLADRNTPFGAPRRQEIVALFADIVGFTALSETISPEDVMEVLRHFHARMEAIVFTHNGSLESVAGDELLAIFGVPEPGPQDASNALSSARAMLTDMSAWNAERHTNGAPAVQVGIGVHLGPAVLGDIGSERRMVFTAVGDTINAASRLERLTRDLTTDLVVSQAVVARARAEGASQILEGLKYSGPQSLRGRSQPIDVWTLE